MTNLMIKEFQEIELFNLNFKYGEQVFGYLGIYSFKYYFIDLY